MFNGRIIAPLLLSALLLVGCRAAPPAIDLESFLESATASEASSPVPSLRSMGYTVQVGAFSRLENAVRLEAGLRRRGIDAYYFRHESGLYKVRLGDHATYEEARDEAEALHAQGQIDTFFIVHPEDYAAARIRKSRTGDLRQELVETARRFLGVPYCWGGESAAEGFDCSGLTMVVYRLNGLNLQRNSRRQFEVGQSVAKKHLKKGDLVFFATGGGSRVSHVGLYIGNGCFIHAPRKGKTVRVEALDNPYFSSTYVGSRSFL